METPTAVDRKPLNRLAQLALRELMKNTQGALEEILAAAAPLDGIDPADGWGFDQQTTHWVRMPK